LKKRKRLFNISDNGNVVRRIKGDIMAHKVLFYPVGNGDTSQIILENGKRILFDFRHKDRTSGEEKPEIDLKERLKKELKDSEKSSFDVVAFTHSDTDHIENSTSFFELLHADKYQGEDRIKIDTLWVPASMILETAANDKQSAEFVIWRQEARYRLKEGKGIRVFSKPDKLKSWLEEHNLTVESRRDLITDAGALVPEFSLKDDGVEFFCHSPFIKHVDEGDDLRNGAALIFNVRFEIGGNIYDYLAIGDSEYLVIEDIVTITQNHDNSDRLSWDLFNIPHHCSYKALSNEKGEDITTPTNLVEELLLSGREGAYLVSSSNAIKDSKEGCEQKQPPHIQAKKCYEKYLKENGGCKFLVTMEESDPSDPQPIEFIIDDAGISVKKESKSAAYVITSKPAPRAGK
jgi:hypothetical protein